MVLAGWSEYILMERTCTEVHSFSRLTIYHSIDICKSCEIWLFSLRFICTLVLQCLFAWLFVCILSDVCNDAYLPLPWLSCPTHTWTFILFSMHTCIAVVTVYPQTCLKWSEEHQIPPYKVYKNHILVPLQYCTLTTPPLLHIIVLFCF
jgi:hypothetical protein